MGNLAAFGVGMWVGAATVVVAAALLYSIGDDRDE